MVKKHNHNFFYYLASILMILGILELFQLLPKNISFFKSFLGLSFFGYVIIHASVSKILFGTRHRLIDSLSLAGFFFLSLRFILETLDASGFISLLIGAMKVSLNDFNIYFTGGFFFLAMGFYCAAFKFKKPSFLSVLGEVGHSKNWYRYIFRSLIVFVVFLSFYLLIFDLLLEWFSALLDNFIAISIFLGIFGAVIHRKRGVSFKKILRRLEVVGEKLGEFIKLFHSKKTIMIAIAGLLILHPISDLIVFFFTYTTNIPNFFISMLPVNTHFPLMASIMKELPLVAGFTNFTLIWAYLFNLAALFFLLYTPAHILLKIYNKKKLIFRPEFNALFFTSLTTWLITPAWSMSRIASETLLGVDFPTKSLLGSPLLLGFIISIGVGTIIWYLSEHWNKTSKLTITASLLFLGVYVLFFFTEVFTELLSIAQIFLQSKGGLMGAIVFIIFLAVSLIFYFTAFTAYVYEVYRKS